MSNNAVLLLGGSGFIGSALAKRLQHDGIHAHVIGRQDKHQLEKVLPLCGTVVHLASSTTPGSSARNASLEAGNIALTLHLLELLQKQSNTQQQTHLIFFSSGGTVYGNPTMVSVTEDSVLLPLSNYGAGKVAQEVFCQSLRAQGHAVTILRPSNAYGPGQKMRQGFGLIRTMLEHAAQGTTLEIWGDGENVRDYIYIDDVVEACMRLIALPDDSSTYNLGSGMGHSINQVKNLVDKVCGVSLATVYRSPRGTDVREVVLNNTHLKARLVWSPKVALKDGIAATWTSLH